jgi:hypothetical protein
MSRQPFGRRLDAWLDEPENEQFTTNKWRFWLPAVLGFSILNSVGFGKAVWPLSASSFGPTL